MDIHAAARRFGADSSAEVVSVFGGHINDTYLVEDSRGRFVLQRVNTSVFREPETVMRNIGTVCAELERVPDVRTALPHFLTADGKSFINEDGFWRMYEYVPEQSDRRSMYRRAGRAFGDITRVMSNVTLADTGLRLHDFRGYLARLDTYLHARYRSEDMELLIGLAEDIDRIFNERLPKRNIHGDAKLANVIFGERCTVLDLDTLSLGWAALDLGDLVRSACPQSPDIRVISELAAGYAEGLGGLLTDSEVSSLYWGILYVTGELAMRYYIDWIGREGYFKGKAPEQCLCRARDLIHQLRQFIARREDIENAVMRAFAL